MQQLKVLNSKETKDIYEKLEHYGYKGKLEVIFMLSEKKERIYVFTRDLANIDVSKLRIDTMGLYFGTVYDGQLRLTIEGTQIIGPHCTKNIIDVNKKEMQTWLQGEKLQVSQLAQHPGTVEGFVILRYNSDYLGCGKIGGDLILNYIPKTRYIHALYDDVPNAPGEALPLGK